MHAVVTGGGTSGHVLPARAIIEGLLEAGHSADELRYVGAIRGVETKLMADVGIACEFLPISGLQRGLSWNALSRNAAFPFRVIRSRWAARRLVRRWAPSVVVSVGGYASDPMSSAAVSLGVPLVCVSYDRSPGLATRRQASHAVLSAVAFEGSDLPRALVTGAPVRAELRHLDRAARRSASLELFGIPREAKVITIMGGSLGSAVLNELAATLLRELANHAHPPVAIFHVCGERFVNEPTPEVPPGIWYHRVGYETRAVDMYAVTDVLVSRAGASTVAEIATVGVAAVIVPWSGAAEDHQMLNAMWLGNAAAAIVLKESACTDGSAVEVISTLLVDDERRGALASAARELGGLHRGDSLIRAIENAAR